MRTELSPWPSTLWLGRWQGWWRRYSGLRLHQVLQHPLQHFLLLHLLLLLLTHLLLLHFLLLLQHLSF